MSRRSRPHIPEPYRKFAAAARRKKWKLSVAGNGHLRWKPPNDRPLYTAGSPGSGVSADLAKLRRAGTQRGELMSINVVLDPDAAVDHLYVLEVAEAASEAIRVLNEQTRHHEALESPEDADVVVSALATMAHRLPQLLDQVGHWLEAEEAAGRLEVTDGKFAGKPGAAVDVVRTYLDGTAGRFREAERLLESAHQVTGAMAPAGEES